MDKRVTCQTFRRSSGGRLRHAATYRGDERFTPRAVVTPSIALPVSRKGRAGELPIRRNYHLLMDTCIFCQIIEGIEPAHRIWESDHFLAFLTIHPCNPGHTCLIPKAHVDDVFDLKEPLYSRIFQAAKQLSKPLKSATEAKRIGIAVEGFSVPHVHLHLVPLHNLSELDPHRHIEQTTGGRQRA